MIDFHIAVSSGQSDNVVEHDDVAWLYSRMNPSGHTTAYHLEKARAQIAISKPSFSVSYFIFRGGISSEVAGYHWFSILSLKAINLCFLFLLNF